MDWDPLGPAVAGLDWPVLRRGGVRLDSSVRAGAALIPATATQTVTDVSVYLSDVVGEATYRLDLYEAADLPQTITTTIFRPNEDGPEIGNVTGVPTNTVGSRYTNVDEATLDATDYVSIALANNNLDLRCASTGGLGVGTQIVYAVRIKAVVAAIGEAPRIVGYVNPVDTEYEHSDIVSVSPGQQTVSWEWTTNPGTGAAWTEAEVVLFDSTAEFGIQSKSSDEVRIYQVWMEVDAGDDERVGTGDAAVDSSGWSTFDLAADWSKVSGTDYVALLHRVSGSGSLTWVSLDSDDTMPGDHGAYRPTLDRVGNVDAIGDLRTEAHAIILHVAGAASADSQPYAARTAVDVHTGVTAVQEITAPSTASRRWVRLVARSEGVEVPSAPLVVTLGAATLSLAPSLLADAPLAWHVLDGTLSAAVALTSTTQYDVSLTCTAADGSGWQVAALSTETPPVSGDTAGFGSTTDRGDDGTGEANGLDLAVVYGTVPTAPASFTATADGSTIDLSWTATSLSASFDRYEIERRAPDGTTWQRIATISTEATAAYTDRTARLSVAEHYRISVRHTNGTVSAPSTSDDATATGSGAILGSNEVATSYAVEVAMPAEVSFTRDRTITRRLGRRFPTVTESTQDHGVTVSSSLHVTPASSDQGWAAGWDDLRAVLDSAVTVFALLTDYGERFYVRPIVDGGTHLFESFLTTPIQLVEVTDVPPVHEQA